MRGFRRSVYWYGIGITIYLFLSIISIGGYARDEQIALFYPSPYGEYEELRSKRFLVGDANFMDPDQSEGEEGVIFVKKAVVIGGYKGKDRPYPTTEGGRMIVLKDEEEISSLSPRTGSWPLIFVKSGEMELGLGEVENFHVSGTQVLGMNTSFGNGQVFVGGKWYVPAADEWAVGVIGRLGNSIDAGVYVNLTKNVARAGGMSDFFVEAGIGTGGAKYLGLVGLPVVVSSDLSLEDNKPNYDGAVLVVERKDQYSILAWGTNGVKEGCIKPDTDLDRRSIGIFTDYGLTLNSRDGRAIGIRPDRKVILGKVNDFNLPSGVDADVYVKDKLYSSEIQASQLIVDRINGVSFLEMQRGQADRMDISTLVETTTVRARTVMTYNLTASEICLGGECRSRWDDSNGNFSIQTSNGLNMLSVADDRIGIRKKTCHCRPGEVVCGITIYQRKVRLVDPSGRTYPASYQGDFEDDDIACLCCKLSVVRR